MLEDFSTQESSRANSAQEVLQSYKEMPIFYHSSSGNTTGLTLRKKNNKQKTTELASLVDHRDQDDSKL
jgi:hypothetical protein